MPAWLLWIAGGAVVGYVLDKGGEAAKAAIALLELQGRFAG